jgi:hypothetical protein
MRSHDSSTPRRPRPYGAAPAASPSPRPAHFVIVDLTVLSRPFVILSAPPPAKSVTRKPPRVAKGVQHRSRQTRQSCIGFPGDLHDAIGDRAKRERTTFAEQVRLLAEWGLESAAPHELARAK